MEIKRVILGLVLSAFFVASIGLFKINLLTILLTTPLLIYHTIIVLKAKKNKWLTLYIVVQFILSFTFDDRAINNIFDLDIFRTNSTLHLVAIIYFILLSLSIPLTFFNVIINDKTSNEGTTTS